MTISFNTIDPNVRVPLFYAEIDNSQANIFSQNLKTLLIGQKTSDGTAEAGVPLLVTRLDQAREAFGSRSMLARMMEVYRNIDAFGEVWCVPLDDAKAGAAAEGTITVTGQAYEAGTLFLRIGGQSVRAGVTKGMTANEVAASLAEAIGESLYLPVTAEASENVVTLTAVHKGDFGNGIKVFHNFYGTAGGETTPAGLMLTLSQMTGGSGNPDVTEAIAGIGDEPFEFICTPYSDMSSLDAWQLAMNDTSGRWSYLKQLYGHCFTAKRGTLSDLYAFGKTRNDQHMSIFDMEPMNPAPESDFAAALTAREAVFIRVDPARPTQTGELNGLLATRAHERFIMEERNMLLNAGIATATVSAGGVPMIERAATTYQVNKYGEPDVSYLDSETMFTLATVTRRLKSLITSKYGRHKLADDGTKFGAGQAIVTRSIIKSEMIAEYDRMQRAGLVENADLFAQHLEVERNADNPNRLDVLFPPDLINQLRIMGLLNQFRQQYPEEA